MSKTINNLVNHIEIVHGTNEKDTLPKLGLRTIIHDNWVILISPTGGSGNTEVDKVVRFLYTDVTSPSEASAEALRDVILGWCATGEEEGGLGSTYIGKPSGGDFVTTYASATTIMLGVYPAFLTGGTSAQSTPGTWAAVGDGSFRITIDGTAYNVDAIDFTGNTTMALVAATIQAALRTATSSTENVVWDTNHFIIYSILYEPTSEVSVTSTSTGVVGTDISGAGASDWMDSDTGNGVVTLVRGGYPAGVTGFIDEDIEWVRQIATGGIAITYSREDAAMSITGHILTVTGATFLSTDTFVVLTNVSRDLGAEDIIRAFGNAYVGKPSNGDFVTAYASATTIDFTVLPFDVIDIVDEDIEIVKQISTAGKVTKTYTRDDLNMSVTTNTLTVTGATFISTDTFIVYTNIPRPSDIYSAGITPDYKIGSWDGSVTYASSTTITLAGAYPTISYNSQVAYIKFTDDTLHTGEIFRNGQNGVVIEHSGGVLTIVGAGTPFAATNDYEVGLSATPIAADLGQDTVKTSVKNQGYAHYTDVETKIEADLGIDGVHDGGNAVADFTDTGETYTAQTVAEGHTIYNITDGSNALINSPDLLGVGGGAGDPTADDINHAALAGGGSNDWQNTETAGIPECKRFVFDMRSFNLESIDYLIAANDANNSCYMNVYVTNDADADETDDTYWKDKSLEILGVAQVAADGIGNGAATVVSDTCFIDRPTPMLKMMIKIIVEFKVASGQDNDFKLKIIKSS